MSKIVQTVLGDISSSDMGFTLTHEHLGMNFDHFYRKPPSDLSDKFTSLSLQNLGFIRQYPYSCLYNLDLNCKSSANAIIWDLKWFKQSGGGTIVENSCYGLERNVKVYETMSKESGVNIIAGTGFYIEDMQSDNMMHYTVEEMYDLMVKEVTQGIENTNIKAGFLGEIASVWPIRDFERKAIKAAGQAQAQLGCGVSFHPHRSPDAPFEILRLYLEAGGAADKAVMSHLDRTLLDKDVLLKFAEMGSYCQFDLFGTEVSYYQLSNKIDMPSDAQRIAMIGHLVEEGFTSRILMSHDIHTKHRLMEYGGHGYSHIINNILPRMKSKGFSQKTINEITVTNPANWLAMKEQNKNAEMY